MDKDKLNESKDFSEKKVKDPELFIQELSERLIHDLNAGRWDYIERREDYLNWLDGADKFPNKIAHEMIRAWRWDEVLRHIEKFEPSQTLAKALLEDMLKSWFYEDKDSRAEGYDFDYLLEDSVIKREIFLSRFKELDNSTALLVLRLLEKNMYEWADAIYKSHLWDCFHIKYFTWLNEEVLTKLSERWLIIEDKDKSRFVWIDSEKWNKYTKIALKVQDEANEERDRLEDELNGMEEN